MTGTPKIENRDHCFDKIPLFYDKNGKGIFPGNRVKGLFVYGKDIIGICAYSNEDLAWGIRWMRGKVEVFTPFCNCCNVEWEKVE